MSHQYAQLADNNAHPPLPELMQAMNSMHCVECPWTPKPMNSMHCVECPWTPKPIDAMDANDGEDHRPVP